MIIETAECMDIERWQEFAANARKLRRQFLRYMEAEKAREKNRKSKKEKKARSIDVS